MTFAVQVDFEFPEKVQAQVQTDHAHECHGSTQLTQENDKLLQSTAISSQESMKCNEDKVQFDTGLPNYATLHDSYYSVCNKWTAFEG